jgi:hypothetical protein
MDWYIVMIYVCHSFVSLILIRYILHFISFCQLLMQYNRASKWPDHYSHGLTIYIDTQVLRTALQSSTMVAIKIIDICIQLVSQVTARSSIPLTYIATSTSSKSLYIRCFVRAKDLSLQLSKQSLSFILLINAICAINQNLVELVAYNLNTKMAIYLLLTNHHHHVYCMCTQWVLLYLLCSVAVLYKGNRLPVPSVTVTLSKVAETMAAHASGVETAT